MVASSIYSRWIVSEMSWYVLLIYNSGAVAWYLRGVAAWVDLSCMTEPLHICPVAASLRWPTGELQSRVYRAYRLAMRPSTRTPTPCDSEVWGSPTQIPIGGRIAATTQRKICGRANVRTERRQDNTARRKEKKENKASEE